MSESPTNGNKRFEDLQRSVERIEQHIVGADGVFVRLAKVEQKMSDRPCLLHDEKITAIERSVGEARLNSKVNAAKLAGLSAAVSAMVAVIGKWFLVRGH